MLLKNLILKLSIYTILVIIILWLIFPYYWMVVVSLKSAWELYVYPPIIYPQAPTLDNFIRFLSSNGVIYISNSFVVCGTAILCTILLAIPAAYGLTRYVVPEKFYRNILSYYLSLRFLPPIAIAIPLFGLIRMLGLYDSIFSLVLSYTLFSLPLAIWLLSSYLMELPRDIEEASLLDGLNRFMAFFKILLPMFYPQLISTILLLFIFSWNEFLFALIFTATLRSQTIPIAAWNLVTQFKIDWQAMAAVGIITSVVPAILFLLLQKYVIRGLTFGIVK
ncbi:MAG: carbohydrate ABC transporter permease [Nitrososphaeria archaeon]